MKPKVIFLVGPTAIGKTNLSIALAKRLNAEIISCDSMQVYKEISILSSKPSFSQRKEAPHHLLDVVSVEKEYNVSKYRQSAVKKIREIIKRKKTPLFVGGSGLYMSVVVDGIFKKSAEDFKFREKLFKEAKTRGLGYLHDKLKKVDPQAAAKIHPNDLKRVIRALEVYKVTGKPISQLQGKRKGLIDKYDVRMFCLDMPRQKLYKNIEERVDKMFEQGLVEEVKGILKKRLSKTAQFAIGINEVKGYLDGKYDLETARALIKRNTQLYSKRQETWFRKDKRIIWVDAGSKDLEKTARIILKEIA